MLNVNNGNTKIGNSTYLRKRKAAQATEAKWTDGRKNNNNTIHEGEGNFAGVYLTVKKIIEGLLCLWPQKSKKKVDNSENKN